MLEFELPEGFMNVGVSSSNFLVADTNNSANLDTIRVPLPKPQYKWKIHSYKNNNKIVILVDK